MFVASGVTTSIPEILLTGKVEQRTRTNVDTFIIKRVEGWKVPTENLICGGKKDGGEEVQKLYVRSNSSNLGSIPAIHKISNKQCGNLS